MKNSLQNNMQSKGKAGSGISDRIGSWFRKHRNLLKISLYALISMVAVITLWLTILETFYAFLMVHAANLFLYIGGSEARLALLTEGSENLFRVSFIYFGDEATFDQRVQTLLYPTMVLFIWQVFNAFTRGVRRSLVTGKWNLGVFFVFQVLFLLLLTGYHTSSIAKFFYDIMLESFYVIVLAIIIWDKIRELTLGNTASK